MTVEEYFEEWWTPKELPEKGFNKTAMLDFAEMYHKKALRIHDEQLRAFRQFLQSEYHLPVSNRMVDEFEQKQSS